MYLWIIAIVVCQLSLQGQGHLCPPDDPEKTTYVRCPPTSTSSTTTSTTTTTPKPTTTTTPKPTKKPKCRKTKILMENGDLDWFKYWDEPKGKGKKRLLDLLSTKDGVSYVGAKKKDVTIHIRAASKKTFRVGELLLKVKNAIQVTFLYTVRDNKLIKKKKTILPQNGWVQFNEKLLKKVRQVSVTATWNGDKKKKNNRVEMKAFKLKACLG